MQEISFQEVQEVQEVHGGIKYKTLVAGGTLVSVAGFGVWCLGGKLSYNILKTAG